jgi:hypothetical protein
MRGGKLQAADFRMSGQSLFYYLLRRNLPGAPHDYRGSRERGGCKEKSDTVICHDSPSSHISSLCALLDESTMNERLVSVRRTDCRITATNHAWL